jgi:hypothetical protein
MWFFLMDLDPTGRYLAVRNLRDSSRNRCMAIFPVKGGKPRFYPAADQGARFLMPHGQPMFAAYPEFRPDRETCDFHYLVWDQLTRSWAQGPRWKENPLPPTWKAARANLATYLGTHKYSNALSFDSYSRNPHWFKPFIAMGGSVAYLSPDMGTAYVDTRTEFAAKYDFGATFRALYYDGQWKERWNATYKWLYGAVEAEGIVFVQGVKPGEQRLTLRLVEATTGRTIAELPAHHFTIAGYDGYNSTVPWPSFDSKVPGR